MAVSVQLSSSAQLDKIDLLREIGLQDYIGLPQVSCHWA